MPQLDHPYRDLKAGQWLCGNLHTHTAPRDGPRLLQRMIDDYARLGHGFLMISDHDAYTPARDLRRYDNKGMVLIPGNEITADGPHMLHVGADRHVKPSALRQQVIDDANAGKGFIVVNHPNFESHFNHCPIEKLQEWLGYVGLEIYNGLVSQLQGSGYATDKWDMLLSRGRRLWGFANDDCHWGTTGQGLGWNVAYVHRRTPAGVVAALRAGRFYASTGVTIETIRVRGRQIKIQTANARRIVALQHDGSRLAVRDDSAIDLTVPDNTPYVRFECWGDAERFAWTQPFFTR